MATQQAGAADARAERILEVFDTAFGELLAADPAAFQVKFRKMAASAFAFYRGTACLFYADATASDQEGSRHTGPFLDERTGRVWIHGDLHAENFGTYMDANGRLTFNVNDFDEAYVGPFTWDLKRFAASVALLGYTQGAQRRADHRPGAAVRRRLPRAHPRPRAHDAKPERGRPRSPSTPRAAPSSARCARPAPTPASRCWTA